MLCIGQPCKGVLLFRPRGIGKTLLPKAVATDVGANLINITGSTITSKVCARFEVLTLVLCLYIILGQTTTCRFVIYIFWSCNLTSDLCIWFMQWLGDADKLTISLFSLARKLSPAVIFVEEVRELWRQCQVCLLLYFILNCKFKACLHVMHLGYLDVKPTDWFIMGCHFNGNCNGRWIAY